MEDHVRQRAREDAEKRKMVNYSNCPFRDKDGLVDDDLWRIYLSEYEKQVVKNPQYTKDEVAAFARLDSQEGEWGKRIDPPSHGRELWAVYDDAFNKETKALFEELAEIVSARIEVLD